MFTPASLVVVGALLILSAVLAQQLLKERALRKQRNLVGKWPLRVVMPDAVDDVFKQGPFGPRLDTEVAFLGRGPFVVDGGTSDAESWILAVLARRAQLMFEFGTCTGKTAYLWARNAPDEARVVTVTLSPSENAQRAEDGDDETDLSYAMRESGHSTFVYSSTAVADKVTQLFGDSKSLDVTPWAGQCDVVFVDGSHAYSYVVSDSAKALALVRPGGLVVWHDYAGPRHSAGVYKAINELASRIEIVRIQGTTLAVHRAPTGGARPL